MTLKAKLFSTIAAFCLVAVLMVVGVFAASSVKVNMSGQISFTANDVNATIDGEVAGISGSHDFTQIVFDGSEQTGVDDTETWNVLNWSFANKSKDIVFTITVTYTNTERAITSTFDATSIQALNDVDGSTNIEVTVEQKGASDDDFTTFTNNTPVQIAAEGVLQYRITFSIADPNLSVDDQVWSNASITLNNVAA